MMEKRVDGNDSNAMFQLGIHYIHGKKGVTKDLDKTVELFHRAAELGSPNACYNLAIRYYRGDVGDGVIKDEMKAKQYYEKAAMAGCSDSRFQLGILDATVDRSIKHWLIAANGGNIEAVNEIKKAAVRGVATKDHYAQALRGYQQYLEEVRSAQRDRAAAYSDKYKYLFDP
jgi:hypothetical protein